MIQTILDILKEAGGSAPASALASNNLRSIELLIEVMHQSGSCGLAPSLPWTRLATRCKLGKRSRRSHRERLGQRNMGQVRESASASSGFPLAAIDQE